MAFRPLHDRVVVRRIEAEEKTAGGIIIPDTAQEKPMEGEVIAVGSGARNEQGQIVALDVKEGDRILFGKWSGTEVKLDGEELLIMKESDIMGVLAKGTIRSSSHLGRQRAAVSNGQGPISTLTIYQPHPSRRGQGPAPEHEASKSRYQRSEFKW